MEQETGDSLINSMYADGTLKEANIVLKTLKEFTLQARDSLFRESINLQNIGFLADYLQQSVKALPDHQALILECCTECVRSLRNVCIQCVGNQEAVSDSLAIPAMRQLLRFLLERESLEEPHFVLIRCCIQFLTNLASGYEKGQRSVWRDIVYDLIHPLLCVPDGKVKQYCCMLLQTLLEYQDNSVSFVESADASQSMEAVIAACSDETDHDFCLQFVRFTLFSSHIIPSLFEKLSISSQIILLHIADACLNTESQEQQPNMCKTLSNETLFCFAHKFKSISHCILTLAMKEEENQNAQLVMSLLDVLCAASAEGHVQAWLQNMDFVLETSLELLDMVEQVGQSSNNAFTVRQDITGPSEAASDEPGYGFKRNLVQLIGNMCFRHRANQDRVRELKGIPTILQQCNIDSKNAFINQWAILAIRNLCEGNLENQSFLLSLRNEGVADNEALNRLGYEAALREDGQVYLKNMKK